MKAIHALAARGRTAEEIALVLGLDADAVRAELCAASAAPRPSAPPSTACLHPDFDGIKAANKRLRGAPQRKLF